MHDFTSASVLPHHHDHRLTHRVFIWANTCNKRNWNQRVHSKLRSVDLEHFIPVNNGFYVKYITEKIAEKIMTNFVEDWRASVQQINSKRGQGGNKLRQYNHFKHSFGVENYLKSTMPLKNRSALASMRCGVAPIRVETGSILT